MARLNISSGSPFEGSIGFSRAVRIDNMISVSGTASIGPDGTTMYPNDIYGQTKNCINIIKTAIEKAGGKLEDTIRTRILLRDVSRWEEAAKAHGEFFSHIKPACTFFEVKRFIKDDWLVEIEVDCIVNG